MFWITDVRLQKKKCQTKELLFCKTILTQAAYIAFTPIKKFGMSNQFARIENILKVLELAHLPKFPYDRTLKRLMSPPVFGREMLKALAESNIVLNVHADSFPLYASNMRLFETTGAGTLLLTDWRKNISELFEPDKVTVTYKNVEECTEKVRWLLSHPNECATIAQEGQKERLEIIHLIYAQNNFVKSLVNIFNY